MIIKKRTIALLIGFSFIGGLDGYCKEAAQPTTQGGTGAKTSAEVKKEEPPKVVVKVNGAEIDELDLLGMTNTLIPGAVIHGSVSEKKRIEIKKKAFDMLITNELMYQEAKKQDIKVKKNEIEKKIDEIKKRLIKNKTTLDKTLKNAKLTMKELEKEIENSLYIDKLNKKIDEEIKANAAKKITDSYLEDYYNKNKEKFKIPERIRLREILLRVDPGSGPKGWEEAQVRAEEILKEIKAGKDFAKLAIEVSEDMYASNGGDMGFAHIGSIMPEIEAVAEKLNVGDVAGPIWSLFGYHIIKLEEKAPVVQETFAEVKENLKKDLEITEFKKRKKEWLTGLKKVAEIEYMNEEDRKLMNMKAPEKKEDGKDGKDNKH